VRDRDATDLLEPLAQRRREFIDAALALLAVHQSDIETGVALAGGAAGIDGRQ